ncbi:archease [Cyanobacteria bacterium FACHB-472]|nr:archease [Cyanobacteria bacterium FACHB-472]
MVVDGDRDRHQHQVNIKAVTVHQFQLEETDDGWTAMVIVDIDRVSANSRIERDRAAAIYERDRTLVYCSSS